MEMEAIRGMLAGHPGPYDLSLADGSTVRVNAATFMGLPPAEMRDARTIVVYGPGAGQFKLLDSLLIVSAGPAAGEPDRNNGHNGKNGSNGH